MRFSTYLFLMLLVSCKGGNGQNDGDHFTEMSFSVDTVIIDPGDEVIFLKYRLSNTDISKDGKYLFNFNEHDHTVEKINLDELRLEAKLPFEKEGPNGTGPNGVMRVHNENLNNNRRLWTNRLVFLEWGKAEDHLSRKLFFRWGVDQ